MCYLSRGTRVGTKKQYQVEAWLGFSQTQAAWELFAARDLESGEVVLIKAFPDDADEAAPSSREFDREARRVAELSHPSLAPVLDFGVAGSFWGGELRYVVEGCTPRQTLDRVLAFRPPAEQVQPLVRPLVEGVQFLRERDSAVDLAAHDVFVPKAGEVKWGLYGAPSIPRDAEPVVVSQLGRAYPALVEHAVI